MPSPGRRYQWGAVYALVGIGKAQAQLGDRAGAAATFLETMQAAEAADLRRIRLLPEIGKAQAEAGMSWAATATFELARQEAAREQPSDSATSLAGIAEAQAATGDRAAALKTVNEALAVTRRAADREKVSALRSIVLGLFTDLSAAVRRSETEHSHAPSGWDERWPTSA